MTCKGSGSAREPCFEAGDARASEGLTLSVLHTVLLREHNRIADELGGTNPSWTDDQIYQELAWVEPFVETKTLWHPVAP